MKIKRSLRYEYLLLPVALLLLLVFYWISDQRKSQIVDSLVNEHALSLNIQSELIGLELEETMAHLAGLKRSAALVRAEIDLIDLQTAFVYFLRNNPRYFQARLIDENGYERLRVDRLENGLLHRVGAGALADKSRRYYSQKILSLEPGSIYISRFDLNVEAGQVERPFKPTLRVAIRLRPAEAGGSGGFLILNMKGDRILGHVQETKHSRYPAWLVNPRGDWLVAPEGGEAWAFMFGRESGLKDYLGARSEQLYDGVSQSLVGPEGTYWLSQRVELPDSLQTSFYPEERWYLVTGITQSELSAAVTSQDELGFAVYAFLVGLLSLIGFLVLRRHRRMSEEIHERELEAKVRHANNIELHHEVERQTAEINKVLAFIRSITDHLPIVIAHWDESFCCRFINRESEAWFGIPSGKAVGKHLSEFVGNTLFASRQEFYQRVLNGLETRSQVWFQRSDGKRCLVDTLYIPFDVSGEERGFISVAQDVTEQHESEQALIELNAALDQRREEAEQATKAKSAFLANMSHEIRTPMNAIIGMLTILRESSLTDQQKSFVEKTYQASDALLHLLNDILDLSRLEANGVKVERVDFSVEELLQRTVDLFSVSADNKGLELSVEVDPRVPQRLISDPLRVGQILSNLLGNAIKFTGEGSVHLSIHEISGTDATTELAFVVSDTGVGIPQNRLVQVFDSFSQADDSTTRHFGGSGLGLTICRHLTHLLGGTLDVESELGKGSQFTLKLSCDLTPGVRRYDELELSSVELLLATESKTLVRSVERYAHAWHINSVPIDSPRMLEEQMSKQSVGNYRVIIIDTDLFADPDWNGPASCCLSQCRDVERLGVVMVVPASSSDDDLKVYVQDGATLITRPLTPSRLYDAIVSLRSGLAQAQPVGAPMQRGSSLPSLSGVRILVVDDLALNRDVATQLLSRIGASFHAVDSGEAAVEAVQTQRYQAVLMDVHMPGISGHEAARRIRELDIVQPRIIALSASVLDEDKQEAADAGMDAYLTKPLLLRELHKTLIELCTPEAGPEPEPIEAAQKIEAEKTEDGLPGFIDLNRAMSQLGGDRQLLERCLDAFSKSFSGLSRDLDRLRAEDDANQACARVHQLKGAAGNIADTSLAEAASQLEASLKQGEWSGFEQLQTLLREHLMRLTPRDEGPVLHAVNPLEDRSALTQWLEEIDQILEAHRVVPDDKLHAVLNSLKALRMENRARRLQDAVDMFDYPRAQAEIKEILEQLR